MILRRALALLLWLACACAFGAERVSFPSLDGKLELTGWWFPAPGGGAMPVIVALHGCGGQTDKNGHLDVGRRRYAAYFNAEGMHMLALDSFAPRGLDSVCETPNSRRTVDEQDRRADAYAALHWLALQPGVDASRMVIAGWSHGAQSVLSALDASSDFVKAQAIKPRAAVAFYPGCRKFNRMAGYSLSAPLLLMIGEADDWTPAAECAALHRRLAHLGAPTFDFVSYPGSYHGFDGTAPVTVRKGLGNPRGGTATVGGNTQARERSHARMFEFLAQQLQQPLVMTHAARLKVRPYPAE
jgi:dienelactone hydrolase